TLPAVFAAMPGGVFFGVLFFALLAIAALTSAISILEPLVAYCVDEHRMSRTHVVVVASLICFLLGVPASLSFGQWSGVHIIGERGIFDSLDFLANSVLLPVGGLLTALFAGWIWGPRALAALNNDGKLAQSWAPLWLFVLRFIAPLGIAWILLANIL
ncbi:MAG: sodium-dependent transporter, partial [Nevskiales bacterium]